eukprot:TRINITY_DN8783_c0_g1_i1.p1 TRINITY_DN8783_c0_g1~~TRINITY_DN8783_c0_g1_i1.p1  ORF type:complete len:227 (+),score=16.69 TRINITY_DN8783_c0_g1_i1:59-739(+)
MTMTTTPGQHETRNNGGDELPFDNKRKIEVLYDSSFDPFSYDLSSDLSSEGFSPESFAQIIPDLELDYQLVSTKQEPGDRFRWNNKEFNIFIEMCLEFIVSLDEQQDNFTYKMRMPYPKNDGIFAYFYKGNFLPSGKDDGMFWRPSQSTTMKGSKMTRRYFYGMEGKLQLRRQVCWLEDYPQVCFVIYRRNYERGMVYLDDLRGPSAFNWIEFIQAVFRYHSMGSI